MLGARLEVRKLGVAYKVTSRLEEPVLSGVDLKVGQEIVGIQGASGCGKTTLARAIMRLLPADRTRVEGEVFLGGESMSRIPLGRLRTLRGRRISLIPQETSLVLSPVRTILSQIAEVVRAHLTPVRREAEQMAQAWLRRLFGLDGARIQGSFPNQLSGGQRQRVALIQAVCCAPDVVIADEPTSNLDSISRREILDLFRRLHHEEGTSFLLMTHDRDALAFVCHRTHEMKNGRIL